MMKHSGATQDITEISVATGGNAHYGSLSVCVCVCVCVCVQSLSRV